MQRGEGPRLLLVGWREWVALPGLGIAAIKAKIDTGARTSALHAEDLETFERGGETWVRFTVHPLQRSERAATICEAPALERRAVRSSSGHREERWVIVTDLAIGEDRWEIELTLARRSEMGFRLLVGREALRERRWVDPGRSYVGGRLSRKDAVRRLKTKRRR